MTVDVTLHASGMDLDSPAVGEILATRFPTTAWEEHGNKSLMTTTVSHEDYATETVTLLRTMESALPGLKFTGVYRDLVNASDIATRVGVSREAVRKWAQRDDFPSEVDIVGSDAMKVWAWTQILTWLKDVRHYDAEETQLSLKEMTHLENCVMRNPDHISVQWQAVARSVKHSFPTATAVVGQSRRSAVVVGASGLGHESTPSVRGFMVETRRKELINS